jgi:hypothetical protein
MNFLSIWVSNEHHLKHRNGLTSTMYSPDMFSKKKKKRGGGGGGGTSFQESGLHDNIWVFEVHSLLSFPFSSLVLSP